MRITKPLSDIDSTHPWSILFATSLVCRQVEYHLKLCGPSSVAKLLQVLRINLITVYTMVYTILMPTVSFQVAPKFYGASVAHRDPFAHSLLSLCLYLSTSSYRHTHRLLLIALLLCASSTVTFRIALQSFTVLLTVIAHLLLSLCLYQLQVTGTPIILF